MDECVINLEAEKEYCLRNFQVGYEVSDSLYRWRRNDSNGIMNMRSLSLFEYVTIYFLWH
ncbi:hypothetical protein (plasmid) [Metabacillus dongyingensis]|nr:hypothetical protein [Metabacillus dongyingensis]